MKILSFPEIAELSEKQARSYLEHVVWGDKPKCPKCNNVGAYKLKPRESSKSPVRSGVYKCKKCCKQYTVTVGTVMEKSHIPIKKWLLAIILLTSSKKGISAHQVHRMLGISYEAAWFMCMRIRTAMSEDIAIQKLSGIIEIDNGYVGGKETGYKGKKEKKSKILVLVSREGKAKSLVMDKVSASNIKESLFKHVERNSTLYSDGFYAYRGLNYQFGKHITIIGTKQGCGQDHSIHINTAENFIGILKRGIHGVYHHVSKRHLQQYLNEFDFRYSNRTIEDKQRSKSAMVGIIGKRLMYQDSIKQAH
ncbi:IS1595 family transposase [candidate division KSB1 bacterium]